MDTQGRLASPGMPSSLAGRIAFSLGNFTQGDKFPGMQDSLLPENMADVDKRLKEILDYQLQIIQRLKVCSLLHDICNIFSA